MATCSSILAWKIPQTEEPGGLHTVHRVTKSNEHTYTSHKIKILYNYIASQASLSMEFSRQEYWSRLPFPPPGDLPDPEMESASPALAARFFTTAPLGSSTIF